MDALHTKNQFIKELNRSYKAGNLSCSLNDRDLVEYFQYKKRKSGFIPQKHAVEVPGRQADGTWVLGCNMYFTSRGEPISEEESEYIWIGHLHKGMAIADESLSYSIARPPYSVPPGVVLQRLLLKLQKVLQHNTAAGMILCALSLN